MSIYDKKLYIKKTNGNIQTANLYTDKNDVGNDYLTFKYNGNTVYAVLNTNGDIDFNVSYNHNLYKIKHEAIQWKTDEYRMSELYPYVYDIMTELPNDRNWVEFTRYRKDLNNMFNSCKNLKTVPQFDTQNVTSMHKMFYDCNNLTEIPMLDTQNVINMNSMFSSCDSLTTIPLLDTTNVTRMDNMFAYCYNLVSVQLLNTKNTTNMISMFNECWKLTEVPQFDTSNVIDMSLMFSYCKSLTELPIFDIRSVKYINNMIAGTKITKITFRNKPANLAVTPAILGKVDVQITFI